MQGTQCGFSLARCFVYYHFSEDAADAPDVDGRRVELAAEQYLWSAIPQRHHLHRQPTEPS